MDGCGSRRRARRRRRRGVWHRPIIIGAGSCAWTPTCRLLTAGRASRVRVRRVLVASAGAPRAAASSSSTTAATSRSRRRSPTTRCCRSFRSSCWCSRSSARSPSATRPATLAAIIANGAAAPLRFPDQSQFEELANAPLPLSVLGDDRHALGVDGRVRRDHVGGESRLGRRAALRLLQAQADRVRDADGRRDPAAGGARCFMRLPSRWSQARWFAGVMQRVPSLLSIRLASSTAARRRRSSSSSSA